MTTAGKHMALLALTLMLLLLGSPARADEAVAPPPDVRVRVLERSVDLGRPFVVFVDVLHPTTMTVSLPTNAQLPRSLELLRRTEQFVRTMGAEQHHQFELELMAFELGLIEIPPIQIVYAVAGDEGSVWTDPLEIEVMGQLADDDEMLKAIAGPVMAYVVDWRLVYVAAGTAAFLLLVVALLLLRRKLRARRRAEEVVLAQKALYRDPEEEALERLGILEASDLLDGAKVKEAFLELSEIFRRYLGRRYDIPAVDLTTAEIRTRLRKVEGSDEWLPTVVDWLKRCDLVKFAAGAATPDDARSALYQARQLVERTRPVEIARDQEVGVA